MTSTTVEPVVEEFLSRQRAMYAGGSTEAVAQMLADCVVWHVPGTSPIAGDHVGREEVLAYFRARRELAGGEMRVVKHATAAHDEALVQLADGTAALGGGEPVTWRTAGVYRVEAGKIAEAWLIPLELAEFERAWRQTRRDVFSYVQRVRPKECSPTGFLGHPRLLEFFEAAFIECWRARYGALHEMLGTHRQLVVTDVNVHHLDGVATDDELRIDVALDRLDEVSVRVHYDALVRGMPVAEGTVRYVCLDTSTGRPTALPTSARRAGNRR